MRPDKKDINTQTPSVTIGIPVLNEEDHIERVVSGFLASDYPKLVEVLIADGGSTDGTRKIVAELSKKDERVKLIDNPEKFQSFALNKMIAAAKGEVFLRADGHCLYADDYLEKNIEVFVKTGAKNVGGAQRYVAKDTVQAGIALAVKSFLGNGGAKYMDETYEGYAETVFLGCFRTQDLKEVGSFNTNNITNQDSELNLRLIENFGENSIFVSPEIKSWYYPRDTFYKLFRQYFRYGRGRFLTKVLHPKGTPVRGLTPFLFICMLITYGLIDLFSTGALYFPEFVSLLAAIVLVESLRIVFLRKEKLEKEIWQGNKKSPGILSLWMNTVASVVVMQVGHFSGFLYQLIRKLLLRIKGW
ncbi:MAG: glycosyltransferase family 2 protein [Balneolaceae bacterium]|nr:glycosyltransferase family 2 protein [Balneolaceae bacterium]